MEALESEADTEIFCPLPQAPYAYTIPDGCHGVQVCGTSAACRLPIALSLFVIMLSSQSLIGAGPQLALGSTV